MAISSSSLMRWRSKEYDISGEIPDYALLFHHNVEDWDIVNASTHGASPKAQLYNDSVFTVYPLNNTAPPDVIYTQGTDTTPIYGSSYYVVRCIDSSINWQQNCDIRHSPNTTLTNLHTTLFENAGKHGISTLLGRPKPSNPVSFGIPKLQTHLPDNLKTGPDFDRVTKYDAEDGGHIHRTENVRSTVLSKKPLASTLPDTDVSFFTTLSVSAIFKNAVAPTAGVASFPITTFPKNILVFYYGEGSLDSLHFEPNYTHPKTEKNLGNLSVPLSFMPGEDASCLHTGIQNYKSSLGTKKIKLDVSSNTSGAHTHVNIAAFKSPFKYNSSKNAAKDNIPVTGSTTLPTGHSHKTTYEFDVKLKSKSLKTYLTKTNLAPIVNGIIIGYTIGKFSNYSGPSTDGSNTLPPNWYFCDGTNGTPDLRGYYPFTNFTNNSSGNIVDSANQIIINQIDVETIPWIHDHVQGVGPTVKGNSGYEDSGSHTSTYDPSATTHNHAISTQNEFFSPPQTSTNPLRRTNMQVNYVAPYTPPTIDIAFIMFKFQ